MQFEGVRWLPVLSLGNIQLYLNASKLKGIPSH